MHGLCGLVESMLGVTARGLNDELNSLSSNHIYLCPILVFMN
jgi:hypothetical protein